jgi:peptide subunit release factor 1 (eRF1)
VKRLHTKVKETGMAKFSVVIDETTLIGAKRRALTEKRSLAKLIEQAIKEYLKRVGEQ